MVRRVEDCPHRGHVQGRGNVELADCRLLRAMVESDGPPLRVRRDACEHCCRFPPPSAERFNPVIASLLYQWTNQAVATRTASGHGLGRAMAMRERAIGALETVSAESPRADGTEAVWPMKPLRELADREATVDCFTEHVRRREPFGYLRYGDAEWLSMFGAQGTNSGGHDFMPETLGCELRDTLDYVASLAPDNRHLYVGLPLSWRPDRILAYLQNRDLVGAIHWVDASLFPFGLRDLSTKRFLESVRDFWGRKILVANRWLAPVAKGLHMAHVRIPESNCYLAMDRAERACRFRGQGLVLCCASMLSECLMCRLHRRNPLGIYVDCGHIFDAIVWRPTRDYTNENSGGILEFLQEHYAPMFPKK